MGFKDVVYFGQPRGVQRQATLMVLLINVIAPGVGTIISAFLAAECESETIWAGVLQILTTPLLGLGFIWAIAWSIRLYKDRTRHVSDEENPLVAPPPVGDTTAEGEEPAC